MRIRVSSISHLLAFVLGLSVSLLFMGLRIANEESVDKIISKVKYGTVYVILSAPENVSQRGAIRETWVTFLPEGDTYVFAIGILELANGVRDRLVLEQQKHDDILVVPVVETYKNLTTKLLLTFERLVFERDFNYLVKADDDTYLNSASLHLELEAAPKKRFYWGYFHGAAHVMKQGKWKETEWFLADRYLPYALGGAYVLSYDLVQYIVNNGHLFSKYTSEDVTVGTWLSPLNITRRHDTRFDTGYKSRGCANSRLALHRQQPDNMRAMARRLRSGLPLCEKEVALSPAYRYD